MSTSDCSQSWTPPPLGSPTWIEIPATGEVGELQAFYSQVFPSWTFRAPFVAQDKETSIFMFPESKGISGGIVKMPPGCEPQPQVQGSGSTVYYMVEDIEKTEAKVHELGGSTCREKASEGFGWYMNFRDPQGNRFGAYQVKSEHK